MIGSKTKFVTTTFVILMLALSSTAFVRSSRALPPGDSLPSRDNIVINVANQKVLESQATNQSTSIPIEITNNQDVSTGNYQQELSVPTSKSPNRINANWSNVEFE